jgi:signal transduction histidine kinase/streptogramin lyase
LGLNRFRHSNIVVEAGVPSTSPSGYALVPDDDGSVWIANPDSLFKVEHGRLRIVKNELPRITCAYHSGDGVVWLGGRDGLLRLRGDDVVSFALPQEAAGNEVQAITMDATGGLWVSINGNGVYRFASGTWTHFGDRADLPKLAATAMATDSGERMWFGYPDNRIAMIDDDVVQVFAARDGLRIGTVTTVNADYDHVLVGGELGLALFDGQRFHSLTADRIEAFNGISGIIETSDGDVWLNGSLGIVRVSAAELQQALENADHDMTYRVFDYEDGLPGIAQQVSPIPTAVADGDGRLWFATNHGVAWIDPTQIFTNDLPPPVTISAISSGTEHYSLSSALRLPSSVRQIEIDYTALSLSIPERVQFRYMLEGLDTEWQIAGTRRKAFYTNMAPRPYTFRVIAANNDGVWNEVGASASFSVAPRFFQTSWFIALCGSVVILSVWLLYRFRMWQIASGLHARLESRLAERQRIARELHDTLLQSTQGLVLRFQAVAQQMSPGDPARRMLEDALDRADDVLADGRDRVKNLRADTAASHDFPQALKSVGDNLSQGGPATFHIVVNGAVRALHPTVMDESYRIGREALTNAFQHSRATNIHAEISYAGNVLMLRLRDDGCGIDEQILETGRPGHWGLPGMRERALRIRARLNILSGPGAGTTVELRVPGAIAYRHASRDMQ